MGQFLPYRIQQQLKYEKGLLQVLQVGYEF